MDNYNVDKFLKDVGRIKFMRQQGENIPYTKRMLKRLEELNISIDDVPVIYIKPKPPRKKGGNKPNVYAYYRNGELVITGTKKEIEAATGVSGHVVAKLASIGEETMIGQGTRKGKDRQSCKMIINNGVKKGHKRGV